jgi:beta-glucuronidase
MTKKITIFIICAFMLNMVKAQEQIMVNAFNRQATSLNGYWKYIVDPYENGFYNYRYEPFENLENPGNGAYFTNAKRKSKSDLVEYDFDKMDSLQVPGDWNSQKENLFYYEGTIWYKKSFTYTKSNSQNRVFLYFGASNYETDVYLNGKKLGKHVGGFTPFQFELTSLLKEQNVVIVKVDNKRKKEGVPTLNTDWWNYGGITRDVKLIETSSTYIADYHIYLSDENNQLIKGIIELNGDDKKNSEITLAIPELGIKKEFKTDQNGKSEFEFNLKNITYWSPSSPKLYDITLSTKSDKITDQIGFRSIKTQGADILLNGESIFLKGISIHEESPINGGRCNSEEDALKLLKYAQSLGCNFVRLAHYPHNEHMLRLADQMGILVWEENPVYWTISWENEETYSNAQHQLSEVIDRDKNRASVIIWSMANETPISDARNKFLTKLAKYTKVKDPTRLISAALELHSYEDIPNSRTIQDPFVDMVDILSFNQYIGWYDGTVEKCKEIKWIIKENKPVFVSEFGAGAKYGLHGEKDDIWTEEYQEYLYEETLKMLAQIEQLRGMSPWILVDFKSPRRVLPEVQDNYNRKGLISDHGEKKKAFYVLKNYYESKN